MAKINLIPAGTVTKKHEEEGGKMVNNCVPASNRKDHEEEMRDQRLDLGRYVRNPFNKREIETPGLQCVVQGEVTHRPVPVESGRV